MEVFATGYGLVTSGLRRPATRTGSTPRHTAANRGGSGLRPWAVLRDTRRPVRGAV